MLFDFEAAEGEWFPFFGSHIDPVTGEPVYEPTVEDAKVRIRSIAPFVEERFSKKKRTFEFVLNPKTRAMERVGFYPEQTAEEARAERDDLWDYAIVDFEGFKDSKTGEVIPCTRDNKLKLMKVPVFDRFVARCQQLLSSAGIKDREDAEKN
jgi:hypothetical protein